MPVQLEREIFIRASRTYELCNEAKGAFERYLDDNIPTFDSDYYKARNILKEGKGFFQQTIQDAKKLLGPIPIYATKEFEEWRARVLVENKIVVRCDTFEELLEELTTDEFLKDLMSREEISSSLQAHWDSQQTGKRKLANIKIRIMLDKLAALFEEGQELQKKAQRKQQGLPI